MIQTENIYYVLDYVERFRRQILEVNKLAREHLRSVQDKMKDCYDKTEQKFKMGDKVLILLPKNNHPVKTISRPIQN